MASLDLCRLSSLTSFPRWPLSLSCFSVSLSVFNFLGYINLYHLYTQHHKTKPTKRSTFSPAQSTLISSLHGLFSSNFQHSAFPPAPDHTVAPRERDRRTHFTILSLTAAQPEPSPGWSPSASYLGGVPPPLTLSFLAVFSLHRLNHLVSTSILFLADTFSH